MFGCQTYHPPSEESPKTERQRCREAERQRGDKPAAYDTMAQLRCEQYHGDYSSHLTLPYITLHYNANPQVAPPPPPQTRTTCFVIIRAAPPHAPHCFVPSSTSTADCPCPALAAIYIMILRSLTALSHTDSIPSQRPFYPFHHRPHLWLSPTFIYPPPPVHTELRLHLFSGIRHRTTAAALRPL